MPARASQVLSDTTFVSDSLADFANGTFNYEVLTCAAGRRCVLRRQQD
jgi:hypothetical protein